jgi:2-polyprenyl-6-methoxyphenol hydroxylase-like FAD-dependent oxidoreductase
VSRRRKALRIAVVGGGPAGLYFAELMKRQDAAHQVRVYERNPPAATFGFGVVFSDRALEFLRVGDESLYRALLPVAESWGDLTVVHQGVRVPIDGNGFAAIGRLCLLALLQQRAAARGVELRHEQEVGALEALSEAELVVAADGANSLLRRAHAAALGAEEDERPNRFCWYGTAKAFETLTLTFRSAPEGVFCAHHYRYAPDMSTFLVEVDAATWQRSGLAGMDEAESMALCERVFADELEGRRLVSNRSLWRTYTVVRCARSSAGKLALLGDALRTAHFSVGSGTRLALEDAQALAGALDDARGDLAQAFAAFEAQRRPPMEKLWRAANASMRWYERMAEWMPLAPYDFAQAYMTRTGRVSEEQLARMAPRFMARAREARHG